MSAFILIDIQRDFLPAVFLRAPQGDEFDQFAEVVSTHDRQPPKCSRSSSQYEGNEPCTVTVFPDRDEALSFDHDRQNVRGADYSQGRYGELKYRRTNTSRGIKSTPNHTQASRVSVICCYARQ